MWQTSLTTTPPPQLAVSPGRHVMLHAAQVPTAGALHEAPVSTFFFSGFFFLSYAEAGADASRSAARATHSCFVMVPPSWTQ